MLCSFSRKFIFVHVYKTGGTSVSQALRAQLSSTETTSERIGRYLDRKGWSSKWHRSTLNLPQHASAREIRDTIPPSVFKTCFKFAFVRNPWSLQLSLYRHVLRSSEHPQHAIFAAFPNFGCYIEWLATRPNGPHKVQCDFLADENDRPLMDFIGRFEYLADDYASIANRYRWPTTLPHTNRAHGDTDFCKFYTARTRDIVADLHQADVETFGYDFAAPHVAPSRDAEWRAVLEYPSASDAKLATHLDPVRAW